MRHGVTSGVSRETSSNKHVTPHLHREDKARPRAPCVAEPLLTEAGDGVASTSNTTDSSAEEGPDSGVQGCGRDVVFETNSCSTLNN